MGNQAYYEKEQWFAPLDATIELMVMANAAGPAGWTMPLSTAPPNRWGMVFHSICDPHYFTVDFIGMEPQCVVVDG